MEPAEELIELPSSFITLNPGDSYSDFGVKRLYDHGLGSFVEKITAHQTLDIEEAEKLQSLSLPLVLKLGELYRMYTGLHGVQLLRPVFLIDLQPSDTNEEYEFKVVTTHSQVQEFLSRNPEIQEAWVAFSNIRFDDLFINRAARIQHRFGAQVRLVGPTSGEIKAIPWIKDAQSNVILERLMKSLLDTGFNSLDGGTDLTILSTACDAGLQVSVAQLLKAGLKGFTTDLFTIREALGERPNFTVWTPRFQSLLDDLDPVSSSPLGVEILRAIIIARLTLPVSVRVQAPVSLLRAKFAHLTLNFGANDLGYVSAIGDPALGLPSYLEVKEILSEM